MTKLPQVKYVSRNYHKFDWVSDFFSMETFSNDGTLMKTHPLFLMSYSCNLEKVGALMIKNQIKLNQILT